MSPPLFVLSVTGLVAVVLISFGLGCWLLRDRATPQRHATNTAQIKIKLAREAHARACTYRMAPAKPPLRITTEQAAYLRDLHSKCAEGCHWKSVRARLSLR